jgi:hypothetical protein
MQETENTYFSSNDLWRSVKTHFPEVLLLHEKELLEPTLNVCLVLCPLYAHGELSDSKIIFPPDGITESRVAGKFKAYLPVISTMQNYLKNFGGKMNLTVVFADKGVILSEKPEEKHKEALAYHKQLYQKAILGLSEAIDLNVNFYDYNDLGVNFPEFYNPQETPLPGNIKIGHILKPESEMISALNQYFKFSSEIGDNKTNRKVIKSILQFKDTTFEAAFWLIAGYLAFDPKIPALIGENGVYLVSERADSLFWISKLTPALDKLTRVQIKAN